MIYYIARFGPELMVRAHHQMKDDIRRVFGIS